MPPSNQQIEPAETPGQDDPGLPDPSQDLIETMHPPYGQEVGHRTAVDPHDVLGHEVPLDVIQVRHREQAQMGEVEAGHPTGFGHVHLETRVVTARGADDAHLGDDCGRPRKFNCEVDQVGELKAQTLVRLVAPGGCEDRRRVSSHVENNRWRDRGQAALAGGWSVFRPRSADLGRGHRVTRPRLRSGATRAGRDPSFTQFSAPLGIGNVDGSNSSTGSALGRPDD